MNSIKCPLCLWFLLYPIFFFPQTTITGELQKWHTVTLTFEGPDASENASINPFLDYRLNVTFTSPSGKLFLVPGFYAADGDAAETSASSGNKWSVRFTPNETGAWAYDPSFRTGTNIAVSENPNGGIPSYFNGNSGVFSIASNNKSLPDNRAKGRLNYVGERYLKFEETGNYFLKAGSDSPENLLAYNDFDNTVAKKTWSPHAQDWNTGDPMWKDNNGKELIGAINYMASKGMNAFSFLTMNVKGDGKDVWPWVATKNSDLDGNSGTDATNRLRYDVSKLAQWEILFSHADAKGMYLHFKTQETENDQLLDGGDLGIQRKLYYRELIARFGHHLALNWNLGEEHDLYQELNDSQNTRVKAYAAYIKNTDPYDHNIVIHSYAGSGDQEKLYRPLLGDQSELTGASAQIQINNIHEDVKKWILESKKSGKQWVVANDEQGDHQRGVTADANFSGSKGIQSDNRKDTRHKVLWGTLMAGGAGVEYYFGYQTGETDLTAENLRSRDTKWNDAKVALDFFNTHLSFWEMETNDALTSSTNDFCFAKGNDTYAIYLPNGGSTNLNLSGATGSYTVKWFNPIVGGDLVNGSITQISGGSTSSIGNPPDNADTDWVALVQKSDETGGPDGKDCSIELNAISDFTKISVSGFSPAYVDNKRMALAINADLYKNTFAAAETTFDGQNGTYAIRLNTLTEIDGESSYRIKVNGTLVAAFTNLTSTTEYRQGGKTFEGIEVRKGDVIRVEFNSNTNGKIPKGNSTGFSRGRWTSLFFECQGGTSEPPTGDCDADAEEQNGLVVIEAERLDSGPSWLAKTAVKDFTGLGYIDWQGANSYATPANGVITAKIKINTPGTYLFQWRSKVGEGTNTTESNDSWLRFPDADDFYGQKESSKIYPIGSGKSPNPKGAGANGWFKVYLAGTTKWTWTTYTSDNDAHKIYVRFDSAATYTMEISGRSKHHLIDRIVLSKNVTNATNLSLEETRCNGDDAQGIPVTSVALNPSGLTINEGNSLIIKAEVFPQNATNKAVSWYSSNTAIARVDQNGTVTGLKAGDVVVTVISKDGAFTAVSKIKVVKKPTVGIPVKVIYVSPQKLTIEAGQTHQMAYTITPANATNKNATWRSSDTAIATVDQNGVLTTLKSGNVEIEVVSQDGGHRSDSNIKVIPATSNTIAVTGISTSQNTASVVEGNSIVLGYDVIPREASNKRVIWSSSNTAIATVDQSGTVTALKVGELIVSVKTEDGGFIGRIAIKATKKPNPAIPVIGVYVSPQFLNLSVGETADLRYSIRPSNASNRDVIWTSGDESIAVVDENGTVTALRSGAVEIEATTVDGRYKSDASLKVVAVSSSGKTSIVAYPNPTYDEVRINGIQSDSGWIGVYRFDGVLLKSRTLKKGKEAAVSLTGYPAGIYVIEILDGNSVTKKKVVKM